MPDYYNLLGVTAGASAEELRRAFRRQAKAVHPDAHPHLPPGEQEAQRRRFIGLAQAYETLSDPARRARYDREQAAAGRPGHRPGPRPQAAAGAGAQPGADGPAWAGTRAGFGRGRPGARAGTQAGARSGAPAGAQAGPQAGPQSGPERGLDDLLRDVESLLGRFGVDLRPPFEVLLDVLLDWARAVFRQVAGAWDDGRDDDRDGTADPAGTSGQPSGEPSGRPSSEPSSKPSGARGGKPGEKSGAAGEPGGSAEERRRVEQELEALRRRVRTRPAAETDVEAELRRLKQRLGKGG